MSRFVLILLLALPAFGQTALTLDGAVARAMATHPLMEATRHRITASEAGRKQAGLSPNPTFSFQTENIRAWGNPGIQYWTDTDTFALLTNTFETKGKRKRRVEVASFEVQRTELERELLGKRIASRVKRAYWAAAGAQRIHQLLLETAKNFLLIVEYHEIRVREGAMAEADLLRIRLENERLRLAATTAFLEAERARIALFSEMGQASIPDDVQLDSLESPAPERIVVEEATALAQRAEMKLARLAIEQGRAELSLTRANARPDVDGIFGYKRAAGFNTLVAGVEVDLPFRNRNQGNIEAVTAAIDAARSELASTTAVVRAEVAAARKDYQIRGEQIRESLIPMLEQANESSKIAQAAYREGGWELLRLLDAERLRIDTETLYYRALTDYRQRIAALEAAPWVTP